MTNSIRTMRFLTLRCNQQNVQLESLR